MNIAYIVGSFPYVSETFIVNQIAGMAARGHHVDVYTTVPGRASTIPPVVQRYRLMERTYYIFGSANYLVRFFKALWWILRDGWRMPWILLRALNVRHHGRTALSLGLLCAAFTLYRRNAGRYDIVHCQFGTYGELALRLKEIGALAGRLVVSFRGYDATKYLREHPGAYDALFRSADLVLPVSERLAQRLVEAGCSRSKIVVHHSGIEYARFRKSEAHMPEDGATRLLTIARLTEKKGIAYAIHAVAQVVSAGRTVSYRVIGEGPLRAEFEQLIHELGVSGQVKLLGWRNHEEVIDFLGKTHILLAPSVTATDGDEEGIPNAAKEAMAMEIPVLGTHHGGIPELIEDGISGFLVPERDAAALAERLLYLMDHPEIWAAMGRAGANRIKSQFDIHQLNGKLASLYWDLLNRQNVGVIAKPRPLRA